MKRLVLGFAALTASLALAQPTGEQGKAVAFRAEARVEVDAAGKLVKVEAAQDLPEGVQTYIEQQLSTWQYRRKLGDKASGIASTWVMLGVCAVPAANGGYSMGLAFEGNGPRFAGGQRFYVPRGLHHVIGRHNYEGSMDVHFMINADGTAKVESIEGLKKGRAKADIEAQTKAWIAGMAFDTETVDGKPVATKGILPVIFKVGGKTKRPTRESLQEKAMATAQCKSAAMAAAGDEGDDGSSVAFESEVGISPSI